MHEIYSQKLIWHLTNELQYKSCPLSTPNLKWYMQGTHTNIEKEALKNELILELLTPKSRTVKSESDCPLQAQQ
jgi:hypothetical protein